MIVPVGGAGQERQLLSASATAGCADQRRDDEGPGGLPRGHPDGGRY